LLVPYLVNSGKIVNKKQWCNLFRSGKERLSRKGISIQHHKKPEGCLQNNLNRQPSITRAVFFFPDYDQYSK